MNGLKYLDMLIYINNHVCLFIYNLFMSFWSIFIWKYFFFWSWFNSDEGNFFVFVAMRSVPHGNRNQILWRNAPPAMQFLVPICKATDSNCNNRFDSFGPWHDFQNKNECTRISSITLRSCKNPSKSISSCASRRCLPCWTRPC